MKIAIYEPDPRVCGPLSWAGHLRSGFEALGHDVKTVSSTKSGRKRKSWGEPAWGGHWWSVAPDISCKDDQLGNVLSEFDFVVLPEPKSPAEDKAAVKQQRWPVYYLALFYSKTPFVTALHGNDYTEKSAPFMKYLFELPNFVGKLMSHSERSRLSGDLVASMPFFSVPLPYAPRNAIDDPHPTGLTVGTTGRFMFNKGSHVMALAAKHLDPATTVEIWGSASTGLGTNVTFSTYEALLPEAEKFIRYGDQEEKRLAGDPNVTEHGNTIRPYHWDMRLKTGQLVRYLGNYTDAVATSSRLSVHVNLTGFKYSGGLVEFSTLEAMDAGSFCVTPEHVSDDRYETLRVPMVNPPGSAKTALAATDEIKKVGEIVSDAQHQADNYLSRGDVVRHNREMIREISDPKKIAATILEECL